MKLIRKRTQDAADASKQTEAPKAVAKAGVLLDDAELSMVSGGGEGLLVIADDPECPSETCPRGTKMNYLCEDSTGRLITYICPLCSKTITLLDQG